MSTILVIDDERSVRHLVAKVFEGTDIRVVGAEQAEEAKELVQESDFDAVLLDIMLPGISGVEVFKEIRKVRPRLPIVFITSSTESEIAIEAMKLGAFDFVVKPLSVDSLRDLVRRAIEQNRLVSVPVSVPKQATVKSGDLIVGHSRAMLAVYKAIGQVAQEDVAVLITGESGTGKELVARAIFHHSRRSEEPFLAVNCAAIPENLLESELFGHEKGAFTGAVARRIGKFEQCDGGTIFLDEVGDMAPQLQSKLLRLLQEKCFERVGGNDTIRSDVRIIAATNQSLEKLCEAGTFRSDLYFRLNGFNIDLPPLRERGSDILLLIEHYFAHFQQTLEKNIDGLSSEVLTCLMQYSWPGNVRELQNVVRQAMLQTTGPMVMLEALPERIRSGGKMGAKPASRGTDSEPADEEDDDIRQLIEERLKTGSHQLYAEVLDMVDRIVLKRVLEATGGNQSETSRILGITRGSVRKKIRELNLAVEREVVLVEQ